MHRLAAGQIPNLMPARRPIGHDKVVAAGLPHRRQQAALRHRAGHLEGIRLIPERAGHTAAGSRDRLYLQLRYQAQCREYIRKGAKTLLMAMTVNMGGSRQRFQRKLRPFARQELAEQKRAMWPGNSCRHIGMR